MSPERRTAPDYITVYTQGSGLEFKDIKPILWYENPLVQEYQATVLIGVRDSDNILKRCRTAWDEEYMIFFDYPGYRDGLRRNVRIIGCDIVKSPETENPQKAVKLTVILQKSDYEDLSGHWL